MYLQLQFMDKDHWTNPTNERKEDKLQHAERKSEEGDRKVPKVDVPQGRTSQKVLRQQFVQYTNWMMSERLETTTGKTSMMMKRWSR